MRMKLNFRKRTHRIVNRRAIPCTASKLNNSMDQPMANTVNFWIWTWPTCRIKKSIVKKLVSNIPIALDVTRLRKLFPLQPKFPLKSVRFCNNNFDITWRKEIILEKLFLPNDQLKKWKPKNWLPFESKKQK
jgi:hypothetical protein